MSYSRYLLSVARSLREEVAPALNTAESKDSLGSCLRTLAALTSCFEQIETRLGTGPDLSVLPKELKAALGTPSNQSGKGFYVPSLTVTDDGPGGSAWSSEIQIAVDWLRTDDGNAIGNEGVAVNALIDWEEQLRQAQLGRADQICGSSPAQVTDQSTFVSIQRLDLESYLRRRLSAPELRITDFRFIVGGRSRQTALFTIADSAETLPRYLVCQRDHPANINPDGSVAIQFPLLQHLHKAGIRVPRPVLFETDRAPLGAPFMITEQVAGATAIDAANGYFAPPPRLPKLALSLATHLGRVHSVPIGETENFLRATQQTPGTAGWRSEVDRIRTRWQASATGPSIAVEAAFIWLERNVDCVVDRRAIVHTDMLLHNILVKDGEISAILDWEIAHIGHPAEDLGYVRPVLAQMTEWASFMAAYQAAGGPEISQREIDWFSLRALLNLATLAQFSRAMLENGSTDDVRVAETGASWLPRLKERLATTLRDILVSSSREGVLRT